MERKNRRLTSPPLERGRLRGGATFTLIAAVSLDGRITAGKREGSEWTSKEDKKFFQSELGKADAVIMGRKTFEAIKRPLTPRNRVVFTRSSSPPQLRRGAEPACRAVLGVGRSSRRGGGVFPRCVEDGGAGTDSTFMFNGSPKGLQALVRKHNWTRIAVVGGTSVYQWFFARNFIDEIYLTLEPVLFGSGKLLSEGGLLSTKEFLLQSVKKLNAKGTLLLHYKRNKKV